MTDFSLFFSNNSHIDLYKRTVSHCTVIVRQIKCDIILLLDPYVKRLAQDNVIVCIVFYRRHIQEGTRVLDKTLHVRNTKTQ